MNDQKINVDISYGQLLTYPDKKPLDYIEGLLSNVYFRVVGNNKQFKIVLLNEHCEYTLNILCQSVDFEIAILSLLRRTSNKVNIKVIKNENNQYSNINLTYL